MTEADPGLPAILQRSADEARRIAHGLAQIDQALAGLLLRTDGTVAGPLQSADLLRQEIDGLAAFLAALSHQVGSGQACDAARAVEGLTLAAQARRLAGHAAPLALPADDLWCME